MNNSRSIWSPSVSSATTANDYNSGHHHLPPMAVTSPSSNINTFQLAPLSSDVHYSNSGELNQGHNSEYATTNEYHNVNNSILNLMTTSCSGINTNRSSTTSSLHNTVALDYSAQHQPPLPFESSPESLFQSSTFVTPMGYTPDTPGVWYPPNFIIDSFALQEGFHDAFSRYHHQTPTATFLNSNYYKNSSNTYTMGPSPPKRRQGGRRPKEEESKLPPEEEEKRRLRRLRNKEAAARCRQRRLQQMTTLEIKVNELQTHQSQLENDLDHLLQEKQDLEFILRAHETVCQCRELKGFPMLTASVTSAPSLKTESNSEPEDVLMEDKTDEDPTLSSVMTKAKGSMDSELLPRPNTLTLAQAVTSIGNTPSFGNETPSRELFNLLSQPTGLTPTTCGGSGLASFLMSTMSNGMPTLETPSVAESKLPSSLTKL